MKKLESAKKNKRSKEEGKKIKTKKIMYY